MIPLLPLLINLTPAAITPMTMHAVVDDKAVHGVAFRYLAPKGWKTSAVLNWSDAVMNPTQLILSAASPDGRFIFLINSGIAYDFSGQAAGGYNGFAHQSGKQPPRVLSDFLIEYVKSLLPKMDVQVTKREDKPLTGRELPPLRDFGMASRIEIAFTDDKGQACTGAVAARCNGIVRRGDEGMGVHWNGDWMVENLVLVGGPKGEENKAMRFFSFSAPTITATRQFAAIRSAYVDWVVAQTNAATSAMAKQGMANLKAQFERGQMRFKATQEQYAKGNAAWREHEAATDKANRDFCDYIGDVARHKARDGTEIQTNSSAGDVWEDGHGNVSCGGDPNVGSGGGWTKLKKAGG